MTRAVANRGGQPAPYTKYHKRPFDYTSLYRRFPHLRHWKHNPISEGRPSECLLRRARDDYSE